MYRQIFTTLFALIILCVGVVAQEDNEDRAIALYNQAQTAHEQGNLDKAIGLYREVIKLLPDRYEPKYQCATACLAAGKPELDKEAAALLSDVTRIKPDFARGYADLGKALLRTKDTAGAESALRRAVTLDDKLDSAHALLADLLLARKAYKDAETELQILISRGKADRQSYLMLGLAQQEQGKVEGALASYSRAVDLDPKETEARYRRGRLYAKQKNYSAAIADLKAAYEASNDPEIGYVLAESYVGAGQKDQAIELARGLLERAKTPELRAGIADLLSTLGINDSAITELEKMVKAEPNNVQYLSRLGDLYLATDPQKSAEYWTRVVALEPKPENYVALGSALLKAQRFEEAVHHFNTALAQKNNYYEAHAGLGLALFKLDRFAQAAVEFIFMVQARPENAINYYFLGICFDRLEDFQQALKAYELFLKVADPRVNQLEIEKVQLRLPSLHRQMEKRPGSKKRS